MKTHSIRLGLVARYIQYFWFLFLQKENISLAILYNGRLCYSLSIGPVHWREKKDRRSVRVLLLVGFWCNCSYCWRSAGNVRHPFNLTDGHFHLFQQHSPDATTKGKKKTEEKTSPRSQRIVNRATQTINTTALKSCLHINSNNKREAQLFPTRIPRQR